MWGGGDERCGEEEVRGMESIQLSGIKLCCESIKLMLSLPPPPPAIIH